MIRFAYWLMIFGSALMAIAACLHVYSGDYMRAFTVAMCSGLGFAYANAALK